jgi:hypothetical protein
VKRVTPGVRTSYGDYKEGNVLVLRDNKRRSTCNMLNSKKPFLTTLYMNETYLNTHEI